MSITQQSGGFVDLKATVCDKLRRHAFSQRNLELLSAHFGPTHFRVQDGAAPTSVFPEMSNHDAHHFSFTNFSPFHVNLWRIFLIFGARTTIVLPFCGNTHSVHSIQSARLSSQCRARNRLHFLGASASAVPATRFR